MARSLSLPGSPPRGRHLSTGIKLLAGLILLGAAAWLGRDFSHHLPELEKWVASHGGAGVAVFIVVAVVGTSLFIPETVFAVLAGLLFGVWRGTLIVATSVLLASVINFALSRWLFRDRVRGWLGTNPRLAAIVRGVEQEGLRFLFLLRLTPIHPVTVSYLLGATRTPFGIFFTAGVGLIPGAFVEVYFGHVAGSVARTAGNVSEHSPGHLAVTVAGLILCILTLFQITRVARRALARCEHPPDGAPGSDDPGIAPSGDGR